MSNQKSQQDVQHANAQVRKGKNTPWKCHYCGRYGHIRPYCFKLYGYPQTQIHSRMLNRNPQDKREWKLKEAVTGLVAHTSSDVSFRGNWYFDSGCSRHMTGNESLH